MADQLHTTPPRRLRVFLCHSSGDKLAVRQLYQRLRACNVDPWLDEENLLPGQDWHQEIRKAVRNTDVVIVCLSRGSISKTGFVQKEIKFALDVADEQPEGTIFLIPLQLEECETPERLNHLQWVNYNKEDGFDKLIRALQLRCNSFHGKLASVIMPTSEESTSHVSKAEEQARRIEEEYARPSAFPSGEIEVYHCKIKRLLTFDHHGSYSGIFDRVDCIVTNRRIKFLSLNDSSFRQVYLSDLKAVHILTSPPRIIGDGPYNIVLEGYGIVCCNSQTEQETLAWKIQDAMHM